MSTISVTSKYLRFRWLGSTIALNLTNASWLNNVLKIVGHTTPNNLGLNARAQFTGAYGGATTGGTLTTLQSGAEYELVSGSYSGWTLPTSVLVHDLVLSGTPVTPQLDIPGNFQISTTSSTSTSLAWSASPNATAYVVQRASNLSFTADLVTIYTGPNTSVNNSSGLVASGVYYYRVKAQASGYTDSNYAVDDVTMPADQGSSVALSSATPSIGSQARRVLLQGSGFGATQGSSTVKIDSVAMEVLDWSATAIHVAIPAGAPVGVNTMDVTVGGSTVSTAFTVPAVTSAYTGTQEVLVFWCGDSQSAQYQLTPGQGHLQQLDATWSTLGIPMSVYKPINAGTGATTTQMRNNFTNYIINPARDATANDVGCIFGVWGVVNNITKAVENGTTPTAALATAKADVEYMVRTALAESAFGGAIIDTQTPTTALINGTSEAAQPYIDQFNTWARGIAATIQTDTGKPVRVSDNALIPEALPSGDPAYYTDELHSGPRFQALVAASERALIEEIAELVYSNVAPPDFGLEFTDLINTILTAPQEVTIDDESQYYTSGAISTQAIGPPSPTALVRGGVECEYHPEDLGFQFGLNNLPAPRNRSSVTTSANIQFGFYVQDDGASLRIWCFAPGFPGTFYNVTAGQKLRIQIERATTTSDWEAAFYIGEVKVFSQVPSGGLTDYYYFDVSLPGGGTISKVRGARIFGDVLVPNPLLS